MLIKCHLGALLLRCAEDPTYAIREREAPVDPPCSWDSANRRLERGCGATNKGSANVRENLDLDGLGFDS